MASQYLARLGIVLGIDSGELVQGITDAKKQFHDFRNQVEKDTKAAAREFEALKNATEDYGKTLTKVEQVQREIERGRFMFASQNVKDKLLEQAKAYDAQAASMKKVAGVMTEQQKLQVGYQVTDFVTQIASGQNALIAFIQQGGQLKDTMGGVGNAVRAITSLFTPLRLAIGGAAAAAGLLAYAFYEGDKEADAFNDSLALTNNYAGITYKQFVDISKQLSGETNTSIGMVKDALQAVVASGKFTGDTMLSVTNAITTYAKIAGVSGKEAADKLMSGLNGTAAGAKQLNDQMNFLTLAQYKQIEALERANKKQEAAEITALALNKMLQTQRRELGYLEESWNAVERAASKFWNWLKSIGAPEESAQAVTRLKDEILALEFALKKSAGTSGSEKNSRRIIQAEIDAKKAELETILETQRLLAKSRTGVAGERSDINQYEKAGGLAARIRLAEEATKLEIDAKFKARIASANEENKIEIELQQKKAQAIQEERKRNEETFGQFTVETARIRAAKIAEAESEAEQKRIELRKKRFIQELDAEIAARRNAEEKQREIDEKIEKAKLDAFRTTQNAKDQVQYQTDILNLQMQMIGASEKEKAIAEEKLRIEKEIAEWKRSEQYGLLSEKDRQFYEEQKRQVSAAKQANFELAESLKYVQGMYDSVWGVMSAAIEGFVRTGKLSIRDFTRDVIQQMLIMQMKLQAMTLVRGLLGSISAAMTYGTNIGSQQTSMLAAQDSWFRADGGSVSANSPYIVGERGPELFVPSGSGTIIPNNMLANNAGTTNVTNNYINAIDTKSFEQRLLESSNTIWAANTYANKSLASNGRRA